MRTTTNETDGLLVNAGAGADRVLSLYPPLNSQSESVEELRKMLGEIEANMRDLQEASVSVCPAGGNKYGRGNRVTLAISVMLTATTAILTFRPLFLIAEASSEPHTSSEGDELLKKTALHTLVALGSTMASALVPFGVRGFFMHREDKRLLRAHREVNAELQELTHPGIQPQ